MTNAPFSNSPQSDLTAETGSIGQSSQKSSNAHQRDHSHIRFCDQPELVNATQLQELFNRAAFWAKDRSVAQLAIALANSCPVVTVWDGERLIGHARATSDGVYRATIWDVVIDPEYQGFGLGRKLVQTVLAHGRMRHVERVYLMTTQQQKFYERIGFNENQSTTMVLMNEDSTGLLVGTEQLAAMWQEAHHHDHH
ncbi:MAG: GNAT family N-acetyltransferase [Pseudanabaenaceae cyanobacterium]|jgi:ribosomal protein S18 acetylase RimI-like enzyme